MEPDSDLQSLIPDSNGAPPGACLPALEEIERETEAMKASFHQDPGMAVTGELFQLADRLGAAALDLALQFLQSGEFVLEERARRARYESLATAHAYRRNVVGPALLDWADTQKKLGHTEQAESIYNSVVKDYSRLLGWGPTFDPDWLVAVQCLERAMQSSSRDFSELQQRTREVLRRSQELSDARSAQKA